MKRKQRMLMLTIALFSITAGFFLLELLRDSVLAKYNIHYQIPITARIRVDFYGAVIPTILSLSMIFCLTHFWKFPLKRYFSYFALSIVLTTLFSIPRAYGIGFYYILLSLSIGLLAVPITFCGKESPKLLFYREFQRLQFTRINYLKALSVAFSYASLSVLVLDLAYAFYNAISSTGGHSITTFIGGMGLADAIMVSGLSACLGMTFVCICAMLIYEDTYSK